MKKKRSSDKTKRKILSQILILLIVLLVVTLYFLFNQLNSLDHTGQLKSIGIVSVDDDVNTTSIFDVTINNKISNRRNFSYMSVSKGVPYNNLLLYLPFDENDDTDNTYDFSRSNDGVVNGSPSFISCLYDNCYELDGSTDYINISGSEFSFSSTDFSACLWIKISDSSLTNNRLLSKGSFKTKGWDWIVSTTKNRFRTYDGESIDTRGNNVVNDTWTHVCFVKQGSSVTLYNNGLDATNISGVHNQIVDSEKNLLIGNYFKESHHLNGSVDEVMIFNVSLDAAEISKIYNNRSSRFGDEGTLTLRQFDILDNVGNNRVEVTTDSFETFLDSSLDLRVGYWDIEDGYTDDKDDTGNNGLIGYWHLDDNSNDASGNDNNGVGLGGLAYGDGIWGEGLDLDGSDDYFNISSISDDINVSAGAISYWVRPMIVNGDERYFSQADESIYFENGDSNDVSFAINNVSSISGELIVRNWNHVVGVYNDSGSRLFINGDEVGVGSGTPVISDNSEFYLGLDKNGGDKFAEGLMDEVMIFDRSISLDEVGILYVRGRAIYQFTSYQSVGSDVEYEIETSTTSLLPEYKFSSSTDGFYSPILYTGIHFNYSLESSSSSTNNFVDDGIINITFPFNGSVTNNTGLDVNFTVGYQNVSACWYSNGTFRVNITIPNCNNITDVVWKVGDHEVRVYANDTDGNVSSSRVFFEVFTTRIRGSGGFTDTTSDVDYNQSDPDTESDPIIIGDDAIESSDEEEEDNSLIVFYLIIGILLLLIFIVIFLLIREVKSRGKVGSKGFGK